MSSFKKERIFLIGLLFLAALMVCEALEYRQLLRLTARNSKDQSLLLARQIGNFAHELIIRAKEGGAAIDDYLEKYKFQEGTKTRIIHSPSLNAEYGTEPDEQPETGHEKQSLADGKPRDWETEDFFVAATPLTAEARCQECHHLPDGSGEPVPAGYVIGLLEVKVSKKSMMEARAGLVRHKVLTTALLAFLVSTFLISLYYAGRALKESERKYRSLIETANDAIFVADADTGIISNANRKAGELLGLPVDKIVGMHQSGLHPKEEAERYKEIFQEHIRTGGTITADLFVCREDGRKIPVDISASVMDSGGKKIIQGIFHDITGRKKREEKIKHSLEIEKSLSGIAKLFVANPHPDFHLVLQYLGEVAAANRAYIFLFRENGMKIDNTHEWCDAKTESMKDRLQGLDTSAFPWWMARLEKGEAIMASDVDALPEEAAPERIILKSQSILALLVVPIISPGKRLLGFLGFDDTEKNREWEDEDVQALSTAAEILSNYLARKEAEEKLLSSFREKELLLREIHHRVNNNLHIISGLLSLQSEYLDDPKSVHVFQGCRNRIEMMAFIHEKLYKSENLGRIDFNDFIKHLAYYLSGTYIRSRKNIGLKVEAEGVFFGIDTAIPCGLVINELVSNSLRHAFPGNREGEVKITLYRISDFGMRNGEEPDFFELVVGDNGIGMAKDLDIGKPRSFGLRLAVNLAEKQLHGSVELNRENGTEFRIRFRERKYISRMEGADQYPI